MKIDEMTEGLLGIHAYLATQAAGQSCLVREALVESQKCIDDVMVLLKKNKPVKPNHAFSGGGTTWWNVCGACKTAINPNDKFCHECGQAVKWD